MDRRTLLTALAVGVAGTIAGCAPARRRAAAGSPSPSAPLVEPSLPALPFAPDSSVTPTSGPTIAPVVVEAGGVQLIYGGDPTSSQIALTIDDGTSASVVAAYVQFAQDSGIPITFSPNGCVAANWEPHAPVLRDLVTAGQVQIGNHTYHHSDVTTLSASQLQVELERNEQWINTTFGASTQPWFRPPYGRRNARTDAAAAAAGWNRILMWNGSFGDAAVLTPTQIMTEARKWLRPGVVMLGHANHPAITSLYPQVVALIRARALTPVTLTDMFAHYTPPATGWHPPGTARSGSATTSGRPTPSPTPRPPATSTQTPQPTRTTWHPATSTSRPATTTRAPAPTSAKATPTSPRPSPSPAPTSVTSTAPTPTSHTSSGPPTGA